MTFPAIFAVLVLYRRSAEQSECFTSLRNILAAHPLLAANFTLLLYDNSSEAQQQTADFSSELVYQHDRTNGGVASAYNAGLTIARSRGVPWLLLLDQDTVLTYEYLAELRETSQHVPKDVVAIVPRLNQGKVTHSPQSLPRLSHRNLSQTISGILPEPASIFNSAALVRISGVDEFPMRYWLDFLDHAVFTRLQRNGGKIWLLKAALSHQLSTQNLGKDASLGRYRNALLAERDFYREYGSLPDYLWYRLRRCKQSVGHFLKVPDKRFALLSAQAALGLLGPTPPRK